ALVVLAATLWAAPACAQPEPPPASGAVTETAPDSPTRAFERADRKMMDAMRAAPYTGDVDRDFVAHMAPHHQGAIDMAQVELRSGKDPALKQLARRIIAAQRDEIAFMERWQKQHGAGR
ncbi:CopM family metallochaperone, partial [Burkholderia pseudomallei]